jgi:hypothetical protein
MNHSDESFLKYSVLNLKVDSSVLLSTISIPETTSRQTKKRFILLFFLSLIITYFFCLTLFFFRALKMERALANLTEIVLHLKTSVDTLSDKMSSKSKKASKRNVVRIKAKSPKSPTIRGKGRSPSILASRSGAAAVSFSTPTTFPSKLKSDKTAHSTRSKAETLSHQRISSNTDSLSQQSSKDSSVKKSLFQEEEEANILPILYDSYDSQTSLKSKTKKALYMVAKNGGYGKLVAVPVVGLLTSKLNRDLTTLNCVAIDQYGYELSVGWPKKAYAVASKSSPDGPWSSCVALFADKKSSKQMTRSMNAAFDEKDMREKKNRFTDDSYLDYKSVPVLVEKLLG